MTSRRTFALALLGSLAWCAAVGAQPAGSLTLEQSGAQATLGARAGVRLPQHCGGVTPSECESSSRILAIGATADAGDIQHVELRVTSPGPRAMRVPIVSSRASADDDVCGFGELAIRTPAGRFVATNGSITLARWDATSAEGSFVAIFRDRRAPRTLRGRFSVRPSPPTPPAPCEGQPLP